MSASNWAICPACRRKAIIAKDTAIRAANDAYSKVPPDQYLQMLTEANKPIKLEPTLREDYELGITESGEFFIIYHGYCDCSFEHRFRHNKKLTEVVRDRICCECSEEYTCDLLDSLDDGVWCPKCRITMEPPKKTNNSADGPKLKHS